MKKNRQVAIKKFCEQFARKSNNITDEYLKRFFLVTKSKTNL